MNDCMRCGMVFESRPGMGDQNCGLCAAEVYTLRDLIREKKGLPKRNEICRKPQPEEVAQDRWMNQRFVLPCGCRGFSPRKGGWEFLPCKERMRLFGHR